MTRLVALAAFVALATPALAQQQPSPAEQALGSKLMQEVQAGLNCSADLIVLRAELARANERIKELAPKPEPQK